MTLGDDLATRILVMAGALLGHLFESVGNVFSYGAMSEHHGVVSHCMTIEVETYYFCGKTV